MTSLAKRFLLNFFTISSALFLFRTFSIKTSKYLFCLTEYIFFKLIFFAAISMALPCGSKTSFLRVTNTSNFKHFQPQFLIFLKLLNMTLINCLYFL